MPNGSRGSETPEVKDPASKALPAGQTVVLENDACRLEFDRSHGRLVRVQDRKGTVDLHCALDVSDGFRLLIPLPDAPANFIEGKNQAVSRVESTPDHAVFHWSGPMTDAAGRKHAVSAALDVALDGARRELSSSRLEWLGARDPGGLVSGPRRLERLRPTRSTR